MTYKDNYTLIDWSREIVIERKATLPPARSDLPFPMIVSDQLDYVEHPSDGKLYTSKRAFRETTKANGCIEVGNDPQRFRVKDKVSNDKGIDTAIDKAFARLNA